MLVLKSCDIRLLELHVTMHIQILHSITFHDVNLSFFSNGVPSN